MSMGNKVLEARVNLGQVPTLDIINLNKEIGDILNTRLLKATLKMAKLDSSKTKTRNLF